MNPITDNTPAILQTPWAIPLSKTHYGPGLTFYSTPSHGGFELSPQRLIQLHALHGQVKTFCGQPHCNDRRLAKRGLSVIRFSSGALVTQNSRGRCEDATCCGCCS